MSRELHALTLNTMLVPLDKRHTIKDRRRDTEDGDASSSVCPYIVACHGAYTDAARGTMSVVLECMDAGSLQGLLDAGLPIKENVLASVARSCLEGLAWLHARKQVHRDIKPSNLLIDHNGRVKISDFGLSRDLNSSEGMANTFTGTLLVSISPKYLTCSLACSPCLPRRNIVEHADMSHVYFDLSLTLCDSG